MKRCFIMMVGMVFLFSSLALAAGPKSYQVTGPVLEVKDDLIVVQKGSDKWELARDKDTKVKVEDAIGKLRKAMEGDDKDEIRRLSEELTNASHKLAEAMYQQASQAEGQKAGTQGGGAKASKPEDDVVDADFEEVKDDKK